MEVIATSASELMRQLMRKHEEGEEGQFKGDPEIRIQRLKDHLDDLLTIHQFKVGDLVTWKAGMKRGKFPAYGEPAIVTEILQTPYVHREPSDFGHTMFLDVYDLRIGLILQDTFCEFLKPSRLMRPWVSLAEPSGGRS